MRGTILELRPQALRHNARVARQLAGDAQVFAMVKADGYGHGLELVARAVAEHADGLGVAVMEEAQQLREQGVTTPLLVTEGFFDAGELSQAACLAAEVVVHAPWQVDLLAARPVPVAVWLKISTGMTRLGMPPALARAQAARLRAIDGVRLAGVMTHFACADQREDSLTEQQLALVRTVGETLQLPISAANSAALIRYPQARAERVRPGIILYGSSPFAERSAAELGLQVTQRFSARLIAINPVAAGDCVGYGATWKAPRAGRIGVVAVGYGDGYPRHAPNGTPVAINGQRAPLAGRISMDMLTIDLTDIPAQVGDEVELWGDAVPVDEVARACGTISYELFCQITRRPVRVVTPPHAE